MELKDEIGQFAVRIKKMLPQVQSEDLTRNALVMPFIQILGYDVFNPSEVQSEAVLDFGVTQIVPVGASTHLQWSVHE